MAKVVLPVISMSSLNYLTLIPVTKNGLLYTRSELITVPIKNRGQISSALKNYAREHGLKLKSRVKVLKARSVEEITYYPVTFITTKPKSGNFHCKQLEQIKIEFPSPFDQFICEAYAHFNQSFNPQKKSLPKQLFFYGGSFNPLHKGHIECVRQFPFKKDLVIVPDYNPFKVRPEFSNVFQNYQTLLKTFSKFKVAVYSGFYGLTKPNPTYNWLKKIKAKKIGLVMGDDNFLTLEKWFKADKLLKKINCLYIIPRNFTLEETLKHKMHLLKTFPHLKIFILKEHSYQNLSSTSIRADANHGS